MSSTQTPSPPSSEPDLPPAGTVDQIDPGKVYVVDVEHVRTGEVVRRDCYDPNGALRSGTPGDVRTVFHLRNEEVYVRAINWARSASFEPEVVLKWVPTGMHVDEVDRIRVFTWPNAEPVRIFTRME